MGRLVRLWRMVELAWLYVRAPWQLRETAFAQAYMILFKPPREIPPFPGSWEIIGWVSERGYEGGYFGPTRSEDSKVTTTATTAGSGATWTFQEQHWWP